MATVQEYGNGKYGVIVCDGRLPNGKIKRETKMIEARSLPAAKKIAAEFEYEVKHGKTKKNE